MYRFSMPPGYVRQRPAAKRKLGPLMPVIEAVLEAGRTAPVKQRHTAKRIFERLRDEHRFACGYTVVNEEMAHPTRFERVASTFGGWRSIQLSYGCISHSPSPTDP